MQIVSCIAVGNACHFTSLVFRMKTIVYSPSSLSSSPTYIIIHRCRHCNVFLHFGRRRRRRRRQCLSLRRYRPQRQRRPYCRCFRLLPYSKQRIKINYNLPVWCLPFNEKKPNDQDINERKRRRGWISFSREHQCSFYSSYSHRCMAAKMLGTSETISRLTQLQDRHYICNFFFKLAKLQ